MTLRETSFNFVNVKSFLKFKWLVSKWMFVMKCPNICKDKKNISTCKGNLEIYRRKKQQFVSVTTCY